MFTRLNFLIIKHVKENRLFYLAFTIIFSVGISLGAYWVNNLPADSRNLLIKYFNGFLNLVINKGFDNSTIFRNSFINNIIYIVLLLIFGFTFIGIIFSPLYAIYKGFSFGFSVAFLVEEFGKKGLIFSLTSLLPHSIILIPGTIFLCTISFQHSLYVLMNRKDNRYEIRRQNLINYVFSFMFGTILILLACTIESYITPIFIKSISSFIV